MAQTKLITDLASLVTPNNDDVFVIVDNTTNPSLSVTKQISYANLKESLQDMIDLLVSGDTSISAVYSDVGNTLTLSVVADTTVQKSIISSGGTNIGSRRELNFIAGSGITISGADNAGSNRIDLTVQAKPSEISINDLNTSSPLAVALGGTAATTAAGARTSLGAAKAGANSDITSLSGLTTPLSVSQGGIGADTALQGLKNLAGLKYITNVGVAGESLIVNDTTLVSNEYRGELKGIKAGSSKVTVGTDGSDISVDVSPDDILNGATQNVDLNGFRITNIATPVGSNDAATRAYVDQVSAGLIVKPAVTAATTSNIAATYSGGPAFTLTVTGTGTPSIDGFSVTATGTRVLIKDQTTGSQNGIYTLTTAAASGVSAVFTRAADYNSNAEVVAGTFVFVLSGSTNKDKQFAQTTPTPTLDSSSLVFTVLNDTTIADGTVTNAKLADMAGLRLKGAVTSGTPQDLTANQAISILNSGTTRLVATVLASGSTSASGIVQLYNGVNSVSASLAATANSVKTAYDAAVAASGVAASGLSVANAAIPSSIVDSKGDLLAATADNTVARLSVGSNGQILTADSSESAGIKWADPSGGLSLVAVITPASGVSIVSQSVGSYTGLVFWLESMQLSASAFFSVQLSDDNGSSYSNLVTMTSPSTALPNLYAHIMGTSISGSTKTVFRSSSFTSTAELASTGVTTNIRFNLDTGTFTGVGKIHLYGWS